MPKQNCHSGAGRERYPDERIVLTAHALWMSDQTGPLGVGVLINRIARDLPLSREWTGRRLRELQADEHLEQTREYSSVGGIPTAYRPPEHD